MAGEAPDPKTIGSWEDAFQYPIAAVRGMERQLRNDIGSNREKLRSLVGASYRDLLGTAESIIQMDGQMQQVESYIGDMAAKILVLSRLLHKKISQREHPPQYLELLRNRLATLRRRLLIKIDRHLKSLESSESTLIEAMCAFSLATSSSCTDVLRHFHHIRQSALLELGQTGNDNKRISKSLQLIVKTLRDCQTIVPARLARALDALKSAPLMEGPDFQVLRELNLDLHQKWLGEDINTFTPYVRHDDLPKTEADRLLEQWARTAFSTFHRHLREMIELVEDPTTIVQLRQELLELWLLNKRHSMGAGAYDVLNGIRNAFNSRFKNLIHQHTTNLSAVSSSVETLLENWNDGFSDAFSPIWDNAVLTLDAGSGGVALKDELYRRAFSRSGSVETTFSAYTRWLEGINNLERWITRMQEKKWTDELDDMDEEEETLEDLHNMLSEDDPHLLHKTLEDDLEDSFSMLRNVIQSHAKTLLSNNGTSAPKSVFLLRVWRDIASHLPSIYRDLKSESPFVPLLQTRVSKTVLRKPVSNCDKRISKSSQYKRLQARVLWEGDPQLPVLPSAWAFRFLHETVKSMTDFGADIWTPQATDILKQQIRDALAPIVKKLPELQREVNGHASDDRPRIDDEETSHTPESEAESDIQKQDQDQKDNDEQETDAGENAKTEEKLQNGNTPPLKPTQKPKGDHPIELSSPSSEVIMDIKTQRLFDAIYLDHALTVKFKTIAPDDDPEHENMTLPDLFDGAQSSILDDLQTEDVQQWERNLERMRKDAGAYWKRTELLFGLLG
ncbi:MAG: hypothetical protein Q9215_002765 [Flavoplaca cf. flavocitrina]